MSTSQKVKAQPVGGYHGVTVELPTVQMNLDYEEKKIELDRGYVRFVLHPDVRKLESKAAQQFGAKNALVFISPESALFALMDGLFQHGRKGIWVQGQIPEKILHFLTKTAGEIIPVTTAHEAEIVIHDLSIPKPPISPANKIIIGFDAAGGITTENVPENYHFIISGFPKDESGILLFYDLTLLEEIGLVRRHTGFNLNSRPAERILKNQPSSLKSPEQEIKSKLARLEKALPENVYLYPTGMGAISAAILTHLSPARPKMVMIGSPYVDTRCILEKWPARRGTSESVFLDIDDLKGKKESIDEKTALVICEIPTNPLVRVPDLQQVVEIAHRKGATVLVDSTIASPYNLNPFDYGVDLIAHSATKSLNGKNDLIGGVLFVREAISRQKINDFNALLKLHMDIQDMVIFNENLDGFEQRVAKYNENALLLAQYLEKHPKVKKVYYPGLPSHPDHETAKRYLRGFGSLLSFILAGDTDANTRKFYDNIGTPIIKAPSLGSEQTLMCLYVVLTHYFDSPEKLARMGLDKNLLRISVGLEDMQEIIRAFEAAFECINQA